MSREQKLVFLRAMLAKAGGANDNSASRRSCPPYNVSVPDKSKMIADIRRVLATYDEGKRIGFFAAVQEKHGVTHLEELTVAELQRLGDQLYAIMRAAPTISVSTVCPRR